MSSTADLSAWQRTDHAYKAYTPVEYDQERDAVRVDDDLYGLLQLQGYDAATAAVSPPSFSLMGGMQIPAEPVDDLSDTYAHAVVDTAADTALAEYLDNTDFAVTTFYADDLLRQ